MQKKIIGGLLVLLTAFVVCAETDLSDVLVTKAAPKETVVDSKSDIDKIAVRNSLKNNNYIEACTDYMHSHTLPIITKVGQPMRIKVNEKKPEEYNLVVTGAKENVSIPQKNIVPTKSTTKNQDIQGYVLESSDDLWKVWQPSEAGIFYLSAYTIGDHPTLLSQRMIYVQDEDSNNYYQIGDFWIQSGGINVKGGSTPITINANLFSHTDGTTPLMNFSIGENLVWRKTFKNISATKSDSTLYSYQESKDTYQLTGGTYEICADVGSDDSVIPEDQKIIYYNRTDKVSDDNIKLQLVKQSYTDECGKKGYRICAVAWCVDEDGKMIKAKHDLYFLFTYKDNSGWHKIGTYQPSDDDSEMLIPGPKSEKIYKSASSITIPEVSWSRTIAVRVKHGPETGENESLDGRITLPGSYEAIEQLTIDADLLNEISISNVDICCTSAEIQLENYEENTNKEFTKKTLGVKDSAEVWVNNKNYISINVKDTEAGPDGVLSDGESYGFSAYVVDNNVYLRCESFDEVKDHNTGAKRGTAQCNFLYIPDSGGKSGVAFDNQETHKLVIGVTKYDKSGNQKAQCFKEITLNITNHKDAK